MTDRLAIVMLTSARLPPEEGLGRYVIELSQELLRGGHRVAIVTRGGPRPARAYEVDGIPVTELPFLPVYPIHVHIHGWSVRRFLAARRWDVVHAHSPLVPPVRGPWPLLTTLHSQLTRDAQATRIDDLRSMLIRLQTPVSARLEHALLAASDAVAVVNPEIAAGVRDELGGQVPVVVRTNAVDVERLRPAVLKKSGDEVLAVGRLAHGKGFEDLLRAWPEVVRAVPTAHLAIVGEGPLRDRLIKLASSLGVANSVTLPGAIGPAQRDELIRRYQRARVVVQPSHHEGLSTVVLEAMACGIPVVATAVGGHPGLIADGRNGRLVPAGAPQAIARAVVDLLEHRDRAAAMGSQARQSVVAHHGWPALAASYLETYEGLIRERRSARTGSGPRTATGGLPT